MRRKELKIRQEDLAENVDVSQQQLQKYETGENRITAGKLYRLSLLLEVSIDWFFEGIVFSE